MYDNAEQTHAKSFLCRRLTVALAFPVVLGLVMAVATETSAFLVAKVVTTTMTEYSMSRFALAVVGLECRPEAVQGFWGVMIC